MHNERVANAICNIKELDADYWNATLKQRLEGPGSKILAAESPEELESWLLAADWEPMEHPDLMEGTTAFKTFDLIGLLGVIPLEGIQGDVIFKDPKNTGFLTPCIKGVREEVDFTVIIIGEEDGKEIVFTFHPGDPIPPSRLKVNPPEFMDGTTIPAYKAMQYGMKYAKLE